MTQTDFTFDDVYEGRVPGEDAASASVDVMLDASFLRFWALYPHKVAKVTAQRAWRRLAPDAALVERIMSALLAQRVWPRWQRGYIPYPATWLNGRRWEDEAEPATQQELHEASAYRRRVGGCMHAPICATYTACLDRIVQAFRARAVDGHQ